jgi:hypothetical protein
MRAAVLILALVACRPEPRAPAAITAVDPALLRTLAVLATQQAPSPAELAETQRALATGKLTLAAHIDSLVASERFASEVAPLIVLRQLLSQNALGAPEGFTLSRTEGTPPIYYLHDRCTAAQAVAVRPWWNLIEGSDDTILVCPDSYRPAQWVVDGPKGEPEIACLSETSPLATEGKRCGCGPNLIRCFASDEQQTQMARSLRDELRGSVAHSVRTDQPLERIFTTNESFRDRNAELLMRSYTAESRRRVNEAALRELAAWPTAGRWAPREDLAVGQNAGILTAPQIVHYTLDRRQRMTAIYDVLWCVEADSVGATPESLLAIAGADLQIKSDGWKELAARPICTNCHARLDYGFQFFWGFANDNLQAFFEPALQQVGRGPLYGRDIDDRRGEAELTPQGFAHLAVAQPEFRHCMARDFAEYVLGNSVTPAYIAEVERAIAPNATSARAVMRVSLRALAAAWGARPVMAEPAPTPPAPPRASIDVGAALHAQLEAHCLDCHAGSDRPKGQPDLAAVRLDRKAVVGMLEAVAFGRMPKDAPLPELEREQFLDAFIAAVWTGPDAVSAHDYYVDRIAALPAYRAEVAFALIHRSAGGGSAAPSWRLMETSVRSNVQQVTPGLAAVTGLAAIEACREAHQARADRARCIADAVKLSTMSGARR